ncbi:MAG: EAL domain-containing protein [Anaerolineales bacterium]|nr:MAG: EAL domain-containing protein [Anaerolineales bacterium]
MHKLLWRQLKRLKLEPEAPPSVKEWEDFLSTIEQAYRQADQDRYLLERSLAISSKETQQLYDEEQRRIKEALRVSEGKFRSLFENAIDSIFIIDVETRRIMDVNRVAANRLGYTREELLAMEIDAIYPREELERTQEIIRRLLESGYLTFERTHVRKDGSTMLVEVSSIILEQDGRQVYQSIARDITQRKITELELQRLANYDSLTGVANRALFLDRVSHAIEIAKRNQSTLVVLFLDLDGFKAVNDAFGHEQGDALLQLIAKRIQSALRKSDTVARLGGDEFGILLEGVREPDETVGIVQKLIDAVSQPFNFQNAEAFITTSVGISVYPVHGSDPETLIQNADWAMYASKAEGKNNFRFFVTAMKAKALERLELGNQLRYALERNEISAFYQPQVDSVTGRIVGVEALARWHHPQQGLLLPERFVSLAEEMGLIVDLSDWMLKTACSQVKQWIDMGVPAMRLSVNLSDRDLKQGDLVARIKAALHSSQLPAHLLELELSENTIFQDFRQARQILTELKQLGVRLAIDDFGIGYSTLSQLAEFPFDTLKIDRHFAAQLVNSPGHAAIVSGIVTIAEKLGMEVFAEGVEEKSQMEFYQHAGCTQIQGDFFSKPLPAHEALALAKAGFVRRPVETH